MFNRIIKLYFRKNPRMSDNIQNSVLLNTFYSGKRSYKLYFHQNNIVWDNKKPPYEPHKVPIENVISVQYNSQNNGSRHNLSYDHHYFTIHYGEQEENLWKYHSITLRHPDALQVSSWVKTLQNHLQNFTNRPKRLLLFVNPYGGKRKALQIFERYGKPLFNIAGVDVSVIVSQRQNQIRDIVIHHNLDMFDSVGCVGGDGTVSELLNGLVIRECRLRGVNPDSDSDIFPKPTLPVGIIPGGSTDTIAYCLYGTTDVTTAVFHIIYGDPLGLDLVSVHNEGNLLQMFASTLSYGYLGDIAYYSESLRWMGPSRYEYCGFKNMVMNKGYKGEISIPAISTNTEEDLNKCYKNCQRCLLKRNQSNDVVKLEKNWKQLQGKYFMVTAANISCACERSPSGIAPYCHLGDGYLHLVLMHHTSFSNNLRILYRLTQNTYTTNDLPFIEVHRVKEFYFRAKGSNNSRWNCDGETQHKTDIHARVHCQLLTVFSRGRNIPVNSNKNKCGLCNC